jgi:hypothetical protein
VKGGVMDTHGVRGGGACMGGCRIHTTGRRE